MSKLRFNDLPLHILILVGACLIVLPILGIKTIIHKFHNNEISVDEQLIKEQQRINNTDEDYQILEYLHELLELNTSLPDDMRDNPIFLKKKSKASIRKQSDSLSSILNTMSRINSSFSGEINSLSDKLYTWEESIFEKIDEDSLDKTKLIELSDKYQDIKDEVGKLKYEIGYPNERTQQLVKELKKGKSTPYYNLSRFNDNELVENKKGIYFEIEFKEPELEKTLYFDIEQYVIDKWDKIYKKAITKFDQDVTRILDQDNFVKYQFFIRGSADIDVGNDLDKPLLKEYDFREFEILKMKKNERIYSADSYIHQIGPTYDNDELPNLRAQFIKTVLVKNYERRRKKVHILDGAVTKNEEPIDRNVRILLFVNKI